MSDTSDAGGVARMPRRATVWQLRSRRLELGRLPLLMGIINVTPDSFSDGGRHFDLRAAIDHGLKMADEGAALLDVGGESTRPYSAPVTVDEELRRTIPVIQALAERTNLPISIDTSKAAVAREALAAGAEIINDVTALAGDADMLELAGASCAGVCLMHMRGTPQSMQDDPVYADVVSEVREFLARRRDAAIAAGIALERIALDPGIGFGKTHQHNLTLLAECHRLHGLGCAVLVGHSRKGFIAKVLGDKNADRAFGTVGAGMALASQGVQILRVHDVAAMRQALLLYAAAGGIDGKALDLGPS